MGHVFFDFGPPFDAILMSTFCMSFFLFFGLCCSGVSLQERWCFFRSDFWLCAVDERTFGLTSYACCWMSGFAALLVRHESEGRDEEMICVLFERKEYEVNFGVFFLLEEWFS